MVVCRGRLGSGLCMGGSVFDCIPGWMGAGDSTSPGFNHCPGTLPGSKENSTAQWCGVVA